MADISKILKGLSLSNPTYGTGSVSHHIIDNNLKRIGKVTLGYPSAVTGPDAWIHNIEVTGGKNSLGTTNMRSLLEALKDEYPSARTFSGNRVTGVRGNLGHAAETSLRVKPEPVEEPKPQWLTDDMNKAQTFQKPGGATPGPVPQIGEQEDVNRLVNDPKFQQMSRHNFNKGLVHNDDPHFSPKLDYDNASTYTDPEGYHAVVIPKKSGHSLMSETEDPKHYYDGMARQGVNYIIHPSGEVRRSGYWMDYPESGLSNDAYNSLPTKDRTAYEARNQGTLYKPLSEQFDLKKDWSGK